MARGGRVKEADEPERRCIATGVVAPKSGLIRFVIGPDDTVVFDLAGRLPGRGMSVAAEGAALRKAVAKGLFARAARRPVTVPPDLAQQVEAALVRRVVELLSLSRKAGQAVAGMEKVKDWLSKDQAEVLIQAHDGSVRERSRLRPPHGPESLVTCLSGQEIGLAFARERAIHAALAAGGLTQRVVEDAARLAGIREISGRRIDGDPVGKETKDA